MAFPVSISRISKMVWFLFVVMPDTSSTCPDAGSCWGWEWCCVSEYGRDGPSGDNLTRWMKNPAMSSGSGRKYTKQKDPQDGNRFIIRALQTNLEC